MTEARLVYPPATCFSFVARITCLWAICRHKQFWRHTNLWAIGAAGDPLGASPLGPKAKTAKMRFTRLIARGTLQIGHQ